jgi:hypothetical protein
MKNLKWIVICGVLLALCQNRTSAQGCFTYTTNYATYVSVSGDETNIYTSVLVDGSGSMNITGGNGCSQINYSYIKHFPIAVNVIYGPNNSSVGGEQTGEAQCPSCYLSYTNYQSMPYDQTGNSQYNFCICG